MEQAYSERGARVLAKGGGIAKLWTLDRMVIIAVRKPFDRIFFWGRRDATTYMDFDLDTLMPFSR